MEEMKYKLMPYCHTVNLSEIDTHFISQRSVVHCPDGLLEILVRNHDPIIPIKTK